MESKLKTFLVWTIIIALCFIGIPIHLKGTDEVQQQLSLELQFKNYSSVYNKSYPSQEEREKRFNIFKKTLERIKHLNSKQDDLLTTTGEEVSGQLKQSHKYWKHGMPKNEGIAKWGLTAFSDMDTEEFKNEYLDPGFLDRVLSRKKSRKHFKSNQDPSEGFLLNNLISRKKRAATTVPDKINWLTKGVVTPVKHQKSCGACWAFSTVETVESMNALQKGTLEQLSVQQVIDCSKNGNMGCNGGDTCTAIDWMSSSRLALEKDYPTTLKNENCLLQAANNGIRVNSNFSCSDFEGSEDEMLSVLANHGPVTVAVDAANWQFYVGGIIQWNCEANLNHAVQIVGYDKTGSTPHYIVRNSWGTDFGDKGYLYVAIGSNLCGIASHVAWLSVM